MDEIAGQLPRRGRLIAAIRDAVVADDRWRWFGISCSLGAGRGDEWSDIDGAVGFEEPFDGAELEERGRRFVSGVGDVVDVLVHSMEGWPPEVRRLAVEYADGVQLDLVLMPARLMSGLRLDEVAVVDKDGNLAGTAVSEAFGPPDERTAREWVLTAWWWVSDVAKYVERASLFEAAERIALIRQEALKLFAVARGVVYPVFGLTSLLDYEPFELPVGLVDSYAVPDDAGSVAAAALAMAELLDESSRQAAARLGYDLATPWEATARGWFATAVGRHDGQPSHLS